MAEAQNSWNEYSKLVLKELETLAVGISNLNFEIQDLKKEIAIIKDREDRVDKLQEWKDRISENVSSSQIGEMVKDVRDLKEFKTKSVTIFTVIQILMTLALAVINYFKK